MTLHKEEGVDIALEHIHNIREALSELWEAVDDKAVEIRYIIHAKKPLLKQTFHSHFSADSNLKNSTKTT